MFYAYKGKAPTFLGQIGDIGKYLAEGLVIGLYTGFNFKSPQAGLVLGLGTAGARQATATDYLYPSLMLISGDEIKEDLCNYVYYKPISN